MFVFVKRRPSSPDTILDLGRLLILECDHLSKILGTILCGLHFHFDVVNLDFFSTVRASAAKNLRFSWMYLESHLCSAMFEVSQHF